MSEQRFFRFLRERIGLDVESVGAPMIERALQQRCVTVQVADLDDYWLRLQQSAEEQQALIEAVIVPETWFFRYPESFGALVGLAHKRVAELAGTRPLRILSLPCSTGEEPYSIAMALLDGGVSPAAFRIDGMDISPNSVAKALQGTMAATRSVAVTWRSVSGISVRSQSCTVSMSACANRSTCRWATCWTLHSRAEKACTTSCSAATC